MRLTTQIDEYEMIHTRPRFGRECFTKADMGMHGQAHITVVPYSITDGEPTKDLAHGEVARGNSQYRRCEHANRL